MSECSSFKVTCLLRPLPGYSGVALHNTDINYNGNFQMFGLEAVQSKPLDAADITVSIANRAGCYKDAPGREHALTLKLTPFSVRDTSECLTYSTR